MREKTVIIIFIVSVLIMGGIAIGLYLADRDK